MSSCHTLLHNREVCSICRYVEGWYTDVCPRYGDLFHEDMSSLLLPLIKSQVLEVQGIPLIVLVLNLLV